MKNERKTGIVLSYISIIVYSVVGFWYVPILLRYMGQNEYGLYQLIGSLVAYFSVMDFGLSSTITRFYSKYLAKNDEKNMENVLGISRVLYSIVSMVLLIASLIVYINLESIFNESLSIYEIQESKKIFVVLIINILITILTNIYTSVITAHEKFIFLRLLTISQTLVQPLIIVFMVSVSPYAFTITVVLTVFNLISGIIKVLYFRVKLKSKIKIHYFDKSLINSIMRFAFSVFIISLVDQLFWRSNPFILGILRGTGSVAVYSIAAQIYMNYMPLSTVIQSVFLPQITKLVENNISDKDLSTIFIKVGRVQYILLSTVLTGFVLFGREFISLWVGNEYEIAYGLALIILIPFTIDLTQNIGNTIMQAKDKYSFRAKMMVIMAIINVVLVFVLSSKFGLYGAAAGTGITLLIGNGFVMNYYYNYTMHINIKMFWENILKITIPYSITIITMLITKKFVAIDNFLVLIVIGLLYLSLHLLVLWKLVLNKYEKNLIINPIIKLLKLNKHVR